MTPELSETVKDKLRAALNLDPIARAALLAQLQATDPELHRELVALIAARDQAPTEFLRPADNSQAPAPDTSGAFLGKRIGPYQLLKMLGTGGMGDVYRAVRADDQYCKQVAIKLVRSGLGSEDLIRRFKNERQILAGLDHPNIAHLLDGGTTEHGMPYFVLELIEGEPIDQFCNRCQLSISARLRLFLQVCSAVQYAHQRLIIHRDIKPGNILVTADGVPKLLDFGIAKILDLDAATGQLDATLTMFRALTPGYASPEQIRGEAITTACDVYSLGVVLYELLAGCHPYRHPDSTLQEIASAACDTEPEKPSSVVLHSPTIRQLVPAPIESRLERLSRRLRGDLDNIILMALRKEPRRRYPSVEQFGEDIRRHLDNRPVIARTDTISYRASKFVRRHRVPVLATALVAVILVAALFITMREARIARQQAEIARLERARAEQRFNDVRKLANSLMFEVHDSIRDLPGATNARKLLVTRALEYLDSLSRESADDPSLQRELAAAYDRVGDVLGYAGAANLGDFAGASQSYTKALAIRESLAASNPSDRNLQAELLEDYFRILGVLEDTGDFAANAKILQRAQSFTGRLAADRSDPMQQMRLAGIYFYTGRGLEMTGDFSGALRNYRQAIVLLEPVPGLRPAGYLIGNYDNAAKMLAETGQIDGSLEMSGKALNLIRRLSQQNPANATLREYFAETCDIRASALQKRGDLNGALKLERLAWNTYRQLATADPGNMLARANLAWADLAIAEILIPQGRPESALPYIRRAMATFHGSAGGKQLWEATQLGQAYSDLGLAYAALAEQASSRDEKEKAWRNARSWYQQALDVWRQRPARAGALDAFGHDQATAISRQLALCDAHLHQAKTSLRPANPRPGPSA